ncbi:MAG TPA: hypothetical protein VE261_01385 [Gaiellaceae bacterium]|jgi:hypothetical protein|nr:hypothetical protein [Gaiellaceae bacterium]
MVMDSALDPRQQFAALLFERERVIARRHRLRIEAHDHRERVLDKIGSKAGRKREYATVTTEAQTLLERVDGEIAIRLKKIETDLGELADRCSVCPSNEPTWLWCRRGAGDYPTQTAAATYAKAYCELERWKLEGYGVLAEVRESGAKIRGEWEVFIGVKAELDVRILKWRATSPEGRGLVEYVAECWRLGANPRVLIPFLPHGFEEKHGIGWDGARR